ncbi:MAG: MYXO-CTERM sorting domain-containing protein [Kofleriaceae bacterium]|nr:MYXO-CTERM sorting domain-containing protein [Kofleriaceae bacterium]
MHRVVSLGFVVAMVAAAPTAEAQFRPVAVLGDPLPGHASPLADVSGMTVIGANQAVYSARAVDGTDVLALDVAGVDSAIAIEDTSAPGGGTYASFGELVSGGTFVGFTSGSSSSAVAYGWSGSMGVHRLVAAGELLPDNGSLASITLLSATSNGHVLMTDNNRWVRANYNGDVDVIARFGGPVPGNADFTIDFAMFSAVMSDDGTVTCWARGTMGATTRTFVVQGEPGNWTTLASSATLESPDSAEVRLLGAAPNGRVAYSALWQTGAGVTGDPVVYHLQVKAVGGGSPDAVIHSNDTQNQVELMKIRVDSVDLLFPLELEMSNSGVYAGKADVGTGVISMIAYANGTWRTIAPGNQDLPGVAGARVSDVAGIAGDTVVLKAGVGATSGVWTWTPQSSVPQLVVAPGAMLPGGVAGTATATNVIPFSSTVITDDGQIGFGAAYPDTVMGGSTVGAYLLANGSGEADLELTLVEVGRDREDGVDVVQYVVLDITNHGPAAASADLATGIADGGALTINGYSNCTPITAGGPMCSTAEIGPGETIRVEIDVEAAIGTVATTTVSAVETIDLNLDNNAVSYEFTTPTGDHSNCAASGGDGSLLVVVGAGLLAVRRRRRPRNVEGQLSSR